MDLASLAESIKSGRIAGAAVDVYPTEPEKNSDGFCTGAHLLLPCCKLLRHAVTYQGRFVLSMAPLVHQTPTHGGLTP